MQSNDNNTGDISQDTVFCLSLIWFFFWNGDVVPLINNQYTKLALLSASLLTQKV